MDGHESYTIVFSMYDNDHTSHNLGHGIVQDHFGVHGFEKIMFVNLMGPRR